MHVKAKTTTTGAAPTENAATRTELPYKKKPANADIAAIAKSWTSHVNANGVSPYAYTYKLPANVPVKDAVTEIAKRLPFDRDKSEIDFAKLPDVQLTVADKRPASFMPLLNSLATSQDTEASSIFKGVVPYVAKKDSDVFGGIVTSYNKPGESGDRNDGEFIALVSNKTKEVTFFPAGNLFPGLFHDGEEFES